MYGLVALITWSLCYTHSHLLRATMLFRSEWSVAAAQFAVPANNSGGQMAFMRIAPRIVVIASSLPGALYCTSATIANHNCGAQPFRFERGNSGIDKSIYYHISRRYGYWNCSIVRTPLPIKLSDFPEVLFFHFSSDIHMGSLLLLFLMQYFFYTFDFNFFTWHFYVYACAFLHSRTRSINSLYFGFNIFWVRRSALWRLKGFFELAAQKSADTLYFHYNSKLESTCSRASKWIITKILQFFIDFIHLDLTRVVW